MSRIMHHATTGVLAELDSQTGTVVLDVQEFETGLGLWSTPGSNNPEDAWTRTSSPTPTGSTGPAGGSRVSDDVPTLGNFYMYTEASASGESPWSLESPILDVSLGQCSLTFDLHMRFGDVGGIADGTLRVQGWDGATWTNIGAAVIGSQQTSDSEAYDISPTFTSAGFSNTDFQFRLLFTRGVSPFFANYDCAIDSATLLGPEGALVGGGGGANSRADAFNSGLRRIHVSKGGAAPLDGSTPDLSFSTIQDAFDVMLPGDVITVGAGEYRERPNITGRSGTVAEPIWIAAEVIETVTISDAWLQAKDGNVTWTLQNGATGRYSANHGDTYGGVHNGDFLPRYSSPTVLDAATADGKNKPVQGVAFSGGNIHIRLKSAVNPNGQQVILTETTGRDVVTFNNCDNVIFDGFIMEGGGRQAGVEFTDSCANPTVTNCRTGTSRFLCRAGDDLIATWNEYRLEGADLWMRECITLNGGERAAYFDIIKGDLADGANAVYEGGLGVGAGTVNTGARFSLNRCFGVFDGMRFGEWQDSLADQNLFVECGDDGIQLEDDINSNDGDNNVVQLNKFINPHGPVISHQNNTAATHDVIRNVVEITEPTIFRPEFLIKTIRTAVGSTVRHAHWYMEQLDTTDLGSSDRSPWYPFSTPTNSGGDEIDDFLNSMVVFPGGIDNQGSQSGGEPNDADGNAFVGTSSFSQLQGTNGVFAGTAKTDLDINADFTLQASSPARNIGQPLPAGMVDPITDPGANDDAGPFPFGFNPGANWPRPNSVTYNTALLPDRWTSPGNP